MSLTQEDKARIEAIEKYLTTLNGCINTVCQLPYFSPPKIEEQSIYVRRIKEADTLTNGRIYKVENAEGNYYDIKNDMGFTKSYFKQYFTVATEQEYTAQQEPKESKGERYQVFTYDTDNGFEVLVLGIKEFENAKKIKDAIQQLLKTL